MAVSDQNLAIPPYCSSVPAGGAGMGPDHYQNWSSYSYGYQLTGDQEFLDKAMLASGSSQSLLAWLESQGTNNMVNQAALLSLLQ